MHPARTPPDDAGPTGPAGGRSPDARALLDALPDVALALSGEGRVLLAGGAVDAMFGRPAQALQGLDLTALVAPPTARIDLAAVLRAGPGAGGPGEVLELVGRRADGSSFDAEASWAPLPAGPPGASVLVVRDVSARRRRAAASEARARREALVRVAGGIAHDLTNLCGAARGHLELTLRRRRGDAELAVDLAPVLEATELGLALVERLRRVAGRTAIDARTPTDLNEAVAAALAHPSGSARGVHIEVSLSPRPLPVLVARAALEQLVLELSANACDALDGRGVVRVTTWLRADGGGPAACLAVDDDGPGFSSEAIDRALEPFFSTRRRGAAAGLGLAVVAGVVDEARGAVRLARGPLGGARVEVELPLAPAPPGGPAAGSAAGVLPEPP